MRVYLVIFLLSQVQGFLRIFAPSTLSTKFRNRYPQGEIPVSLGNFGNPQYGRTLTGQLVVEQGSYSLGCSRLMPLDAEQFSSHILMIDRGDCAFVLKVRHAQEIGAKAVIIVDNQDEEINSFIMSDNGSAGNLNIPALLISKEDGSLIRDFVGLSRQTEVVLTITFTVNKSINKNLDLKIFMQSSSNTALEILKDLREYISFFPKLTFTPHYSIFECRPCRESGFSQLKNECISGGRYCAYDPDGTESLEGKDTIVEDLRQLCIHRVAGKDYSIWFDYISEFYEKCFQDLNNKCIQQAMKNSGVNVKKVQECIENSVEGNDLYLDDNSVMRQEDLWYRQERIPFNPAIIINNLTYRGDLEIDLVLEALCATYYTEFLPEYCQDKKKPSPRTTKAKSGWLWFVVIAVIIIIIAILAIYRLWLGRELKKDMKHQVGEAVASYFQLAEMSKN